MKAPMRKNVAGFLCALVVLSGGSSVAASDRFEGEGAALRLVAEPPDAAGRFRAALLVDLKPGWKTYWLDPGEAGISPSLHFEGAREVLASFPAPHRFDDGFAKSIVYSAPFAVALEGQLDARAAKPGVRATLGLCQDICIPVSAELDADPTGTDETRSAVDAAFAALPEPSTTDRGIVGAALSRNASVLTLTVRPAGALAAGADLFAAPSAGGWAFGPPDVVRIEGDEAHVALPVTAKPRKGADAPFAVETILAGPAGNWRAGSLPVRREP